MSDDVYVLPRLALERLVLDALAATGLRTDLAIVAAQAHVTGEEVQAALQSWSRWSTRNCLECQLSPTTCPFLNAVQDGRPLKHAIGKSIEAEPFTCPAKVPRT